MSRDGGYSVLVVEDDDNHRLLISIAFERRHPEARIRSLGRAESAIAHLTEIDRARRAGETGVAPPDVIVLDLSMAGIGGVGFLRWVLEQPEWIQEIPVVVFSSSDDPQVARQCYSLGAREYKEKPADFGELVDVVNRVLEKWSPTSGDRP